MKHSARFLRQADHLRPPVTGMVFADNQAIPLHPAQRVGQGRLLNIDLADELAFLGELRQFPLVDALVLAQAVSNDVLEIETVEF